MYHYFMDLDFRWTVQGGLKMLLIRLDSIESTRIVPLLSNRHVGSRFAQTATPFESSRIVKCLRRIDSVWVYWTWMSEWDLNPWPFITGAMLMCKQTNQPIHMQRVYK